jgi:hypothetical protein
MSLYLVYNFFLNLYSNFISFKEEEKEQALWCPSSIRCFGINTYLQWETLKLPEAWANEAKLPNFR